MEDETKNEPAQQQEQTQEQQAKTYSEADYNALQAKLDAVTGQLNDANDKIKSYADMDIDGIKQSAADWQKKYEAAQDQMQQLEARRSELQSTSNKYTAVRNWLDTFKETAATGDIYDPDNAAVMKAMVEYIVVHRDRMEIHLKCGVTIEKEYV